MESVQIPPTPHHYAGLGVQSPETGLDQYGYLQIMDEPEYGEQTQVRMKI